MDSRAKEVNRVVKGYDKYLFARRECNGGLHVYRRTPSNSACPYQFVFALTDSWTASGRPVDWGLEVVLNRLRAIDCWKSENIFKQLEIDREKAEESRKRGMATTIEAFLYDFRRDFAKATNDINTSSLAKVDRRAIKGA